jgi:inhibitor of cysteine peptidase
MVREACLVAVLLATLGLVAGCRAPKPEEVELGASDDGGQVELEQGQILVITLESNPTTGYGWEVAEIDESVLRQKGSALYEPTGPEDADGAGGLVTFRFEAVGAGQTALKLVYLCGCEEDEEPADTFSANAVVR